MLNTRTVVLLAALAGLAGLIGWATLGPVGAAVVIGLSLLTSTAAYRGRAQASLRQMGGRPVQWYEAPELYELVARLASRAGLPMPRIYLMPGGMANAVTVATASSSAIGLTEPLLRHLPPAEVAAVIAHELAHVGHKDLPLAMVAAGLAGAATALAEMARFGVVFGWLMGLPVDLGELAVALAVAAGIPAVALALRMGISREREFLADAGAAALVGSPELMAQALWRLDRINRTTWWQRLFGLGVPTQPAEPAGIAALFSSHPPTRQRIARLRAMGRHAGTRGPGRPHPSLVYFAVEW